MLPNLLRPRVTRAATFALVGFQLTVFGVIAAEAYSLAVEIAALEEEIAASELAAREAALKDECNSALWPNIPMRCLERVQSRRVR